MAKPKEPRAKPKMTPEAREKLRQKALAQWRDKNSKIHSHQRERRQPPKHAPELIRQAIAEYGANVTALCEVLKCPRSVFFDWLKRRDDMREAYEQGRAIMEEKLTSLLYRQAQEGYAPAAMFLLKAKFHWRDNGPIPPEKEESPQDKAAKIRDALAAIRKVDGDADN